jgi:hypothetical protein
MGQKLAVTPIYGWGWHDNQAKWIDAPGPFSMEISSQDDSEPPKYVLGFVTVPDHLLSNLWVLLLLRHADGATRDYNLYAFVERPDPTGAPGATLKQPAVLGGYAMTSQ